MHHSNNTYKCLKEFDGKASLSAVISLLLGERERQEVLYPDHWTNGQTYTENLAKITEEYLEVVRDVNDEKPVAELLVEVIQLMALLGGWAQFLLAEKLKEEIDGV